MSEDLKDEIEALNSIYGDGTLGPAMGEAPCSNIWILQLPRGDEGEEDDASSLRIRFPPTYPESSAPQVLGTEHASGGRRGAGERDLRLFREAVESSWQAGAVCLFDAVEDFGRRLQEEKEQEEADAAAEEGVPSERPEKAEAQMEELLATMSPPPWTLSEVVTDMKSTFIAHVAPVTSPDQASLYIAHLLASDKRIRTATHNITAWRIREDENGSGTTYQDSDDDGETAAGARVLHLMQLMGLWNAVVVVTRWYGGVKLGPRRFAVINAVARDGFVRAGMVTEKSEGGKKKGK
jgi:hypothetical protein